MSTLILNALSTSFEASKTGAILGSWASVRGAPNADSVDTNTPVLVRTDFQLGSIQYLVVRYGLAFPPLPTGFVATAMTLRTFWEVNESFGSDDGTSLVACKGSYAIPGVVAGYSALTFASLGGNLDILTTPQGQYNNMVFTTMPTHTGIIKTMLTTLLDVNNTTPGGLNDIQITNASGANPPQLIVTGRFRSAKNSLMMTGLGV